MITGIGRVSELIEIAGRCVVFAELASNDKARDRFVISEQVIAAAPGEGCRALWLGQHSGR